MTLKQRPAQACAGERVRVAVVLPRRRGVNLDAAEVLGAGEAVLAGADQASWRAMVGVERPAVEMLRDEHVGRQGILE